MNHSHALPADAHVKEYADRGFTVARQLFSPAEADHLRSHFMDLRARGTYPGDMAGADIGSDDPLKRYPRMIHMHRWDVLSRAWLTDPRLGAWLDALVGQEAVAVQTMLYFKPAGARGQALHQDQYYLRAAPGTCIAAWLALDDCDEENGCMRMVPGSQNWPLLCPEPADITASFTDIVVPLPPGAVAQPVTMAAGDVLFFGGSVVHGSFPNRSKDRFRRALIGHYVEARAEKLTDFDQPLLRMDGTEYRIAAADTGGACGEWRHSATGVDVVLRSQEAAAAHE